MDDVNRTMSKADYEEHVATLRDNMRQALAGRRKYVVDEETGEEVQGERQPETQDG